MISKLVHGSSIRVTENVLTKQLIRGKYDASVVSLEANETIPRTQPLTLLH